MKTKINLHSFALTSIALAFFLILVSSVASASISETRITNMEQHNSPAIYGNTIVWQIPQWKLGCLHIRSLHQKRDSHYKFGTSNGSCYIWK